MATTPNTKNRKTDKQEFISFLRESVSKVTDSNLLDRIKYTLNAVDQNKDVAKSDLYDLVKEVVGATTPAPVPVMENSLKPKLGKKTESVEKVKDEQPKEEETEKKEETKDDTKENEDTKVEQPKKEVPEQPKKEVPKKSLKKGGKKKEETPAETPAVVETTDGLTKKDLPLARIFPKEIDHESLGKLVACPDKYHTMKEIREALEQEKTLVFAAYWTKRHLKEFAYAQTYEVPTPKDGFPHDLDILQALYVCEGIDRIYALSTYTEAMFRFLEEDLVPTECEGNDGEKFMMRYSAGLEFEIYEIVEGAE